MFEKSIHTLDLTEFLMYSADLNMSTVSGTTHIKTLFNFSPSIDEDFIGNAFCRSDGYVTQLIHI